MSKSGSGKPGDKDTRMNATPTQSYRQRIYQSYVSARDQSLAPDSLDGLRPRLPYLRRLVRLHLPPDRQCSILELGCGYGALLYALREAGYENARGVDGSPEQVAAAQRLGIPGVESGDLMEWLAATDAASLDVVIAFDVIEHFCKSELIPLVDEVHRVLKIIHAPNAEGPFAGRMRYWDFTHELAFSRASLDQLLRASGFASVEVHEDRPVPHGPISIIRAALWRCIRVGLLAYIAVETGELDRRAIFSHNLLAIAYR